MHPANVSCLTAAGIDCCTLANNHVLDWGREGLVETLATLRGAGLATAGAGETAAEATAPAVLATRGPGRVLVWAWGSTTSGIPLAWGAGRERPGVALLPDLSAATARRLGAAIRRRRRPEDLVVVSIHWGGNWGYDVPDEQRELAHALIEEGEVDLVHGHSSHHAKGIEVFRGRPILYGCGDFVNDYEGIGGHERYRSELVLGYLVTMDSTTHRLVALEMLPFHRRRFRLTRAAPDEIRWLREVLDRESGALGAGVDAGSEGRLVLRWD
jgi:poly-gamma-glutamate capsule biosynthesis protein CapA/YwtB (metallophosphatase superfamily)